MSKTKTTFAALTVGTTYSFTTVRGTEVLEGNLTEIKSTTKGDWFVFTLPCGKTVTTRRAAIKA